MDLLHSKLAEDALRLPVDARAALVGILIDSLDEEVDADAESQWEAEIERRADEVRSGTAQPIPWSHARSVVLGR